jgi:hypothetical protein
MKNLFLLSDLGLLSYYLGIEVWQGPDGITLRQSAYAGKILEHCGMGLCNPSTSPMESRLKLSKVGAEEAMNITEYWSVIGTLRYLLHTRPDLTFIVSYLSRFMEALCTDHLTTVKRVLWYTKREDGPPKLIGYIDVDMAGDVDTRRSTSRRKPNHLAGGQAACRSSVLMRGGVHCHGRSSLSRCMVGVASNRHAWDRGASAGA